MKRILSIILCAVMVAGILSVSVSANEPQKSDGSFSISDIEVSGKTATVAIKNSEACKIVTAIYDPDTGRMLASGITDAEKNAGSVQVTFDIQTMPEYFIARAFALDGKMSALCAKYESQLYTKTFDGYCRVKFFVYESGNDETTAVSGACVTSINGFGDNESDGRWDDRTVQTGENGEAVFCFKPGSHTVKVSAQGYFEATKAFTVTEGGETVEIIMIKNNGADQEESASDGTGSNDGWFGEKDLYFGSYPQTDVTESMGSVLNSEAANWKSYRYYSNPGAALYGSYDGMMIPGDYMLYCDVAYSGEKYRGVTFSIYRPLSTGRDIEADPELSYQRNNGYTTGNVYWFRYEPIEWRLINPQTGLFTTKMLIDSQPFVNFVKKNSDGNYYNDKEKPANDWETSSLRTWLNNDFYRTAFTADQQNKILAEDGDKVFILNEDQAANPVYFTNRFPREAKGSDYARCQGLSNGRGSLYSDWLLKTPGYSSLYTCEICYDGGLSELSAVCSNITGIRPAIKLDLQSLGTPSNAPIGAAQSTGAFDYRCAECKPGNDYILLNVTNYGDDFTLTTANLEYIDQITADSDGAVYGKFMPRNNVPGSVTLLIGEFGSDISARIISSEEEFEFPTFYIINYQSTLPVEYKSKLIFHTDTEAPEGYRIVWSTGAMGSTCTIDSAVNPEYKIKADIIRISDNMVVKSTSVETVTVDTGIFARIIAFFKQLFRILPVYEDNRLQK